MPYKYNESRRHKIPKARYRVTNWPEYEAALIRRGSVTVWLTEEAVAAWHAPATGERGGQPVYSEIAIETGLALRLVFHQPLRQTEGLLRSIGLKIYGEGEWLDQKHGVRSRRRWRKLHVGIDAGTHDIVASELTPDDVGDVSEVPELLDQVDAGIASMTADGAYDGTAVYEAVAERHPEAAIIIPP